MEFLRSTPAADVNYYKMSASQHNTEQGINRGIPTCEQRILSLADRKGQLSLLDSLLQISGRQPSTRDHDSDWVAQGIQVLARILADEQDIRALAGGNGS